MKRQTTDRERQAAQFEIDTRRGLMRMGIIKSLSARILDETNDAGEVVIEFYFEPMPPVDQITL